MRNSQSASGTKTDREEALNYARFRLHLAEVRNDLLHRRSAGELTNQEFNDQYGAILKEFSDIAHASSVRDIEVLWTAIDKLDTLPKRVQAIRSHFGLSQRDFADLLGVQQASISRWESGTSEPTEENLETLAELAELKTSVIKYGSREPTSIGYVFEERVPIVGAINSDGTVNMWDGGRDGEIQALVERPREGRPAKDVVAIEVDDLLGGMAPLANSWLLFFRADNHPTLDEAKGFLSVLRCHRHRGVVHIIGTLSHGSKPERYTVLSFHGHPIANIDSIEWASPIISIRPTVPASIAEEESDT